MTEKWTPRKQNLLMYFETCLVDGEGQFDYRYINEEEVGWIEEWCASGLVDFSLTGRWIRFTDEAWSLAHRFRKERSERMIERRIEND